MISKRDDEIRKKSASLLVNGPYHKDDKRKLRRACLSTQSHQTLRIRIVHTQRINVGAGKLNLNPRRITACSFDECHYGLCMCDRNHFLMSSENCMTGTGVRLFTFCMNSIGGDSCELSMYSLHDWLWKSMILLPRYSSCKTGTDVDRGLDSLAVYLTLISVLRGLGILAA